MTTAVKKKAPNGTKYRLSKLLSRDTIEERNAIVVRWYRYGGRVARNYYRKDSTILDQDDWAQDAALAMTMEFVDFDPSRIKLKNWVVTKSRQVTSKRCRHERFCGRNRVVYGGEHLPYDTLAKQDPTTEECPDWLGSDIDSMLAALPVEQADAIRMRYIEGRSLGDISKITGERPGTISTRTRLGFERIRKLAKYGKFERLRRFAETI